MKAVAEILPDPRSPLLIKHQTEQLLRQRVFGLCQGYEDLNDHDSLRDDLALQTVLGRDTAAASSPTLCRFENRADRATAVSTHRLLVEQFIASFKDAPTELVLDFDATDDIVHGNQDGRHFSGYYDNYCFLPLYVFCGEQLLTAYLRPAKKDAALHAAAILKLLVDRLRESWPGVRILFRGDSGFCRPLLMSWCERNGVDYVIGLAKNSRLHALSASWYDAAATAFEETQLSIVPRGASINRATTATSIVLCDMWNNVAVTAIGDKVGGIVSFVCSQRLGLTTRNGIQHCQSGTNSACSGSCRSGCKG